MDLRPYQLEIVLAVLDDARGFHRPLIVAPTGSGKTVIAAEITRRCENKHILFLAHRRELIFQTRDHLAEFGVAAGVILAGEPLNLMRGVQVASVQTLWSRCVRGDRDLPYADIVFIDEAHHARARTYRKIIEGYPNALIIGLTATPCRKDGRGLGSTFDTMIQCPQVEELIDLDFLVKTRVFAPSAPDLKGVRVRQGDYVESELAERMDRPKLVGDIVAHWHRHAERRKTVVFASSVGHSIHLAEEFVKSGVCAEHIDGKTPKDERDAILTAAIIGRPRARHQLPGVGRGLGSAGRFVLRPGETDQVSRSLSPNGRQGHSSRTRQDGRPDPRPCRCRLHARLHRGSS